MNKQDIEQIIEEKNQTSLKNPKLLFVPIQSHYERRMQRESNRLCVSAARIKVEINIHSDGMYLWQLAKRRLLSGSSYLKSNQ